MDFTVEASISQNGMISAEIKSDMQNVEYAFYVLKDGVRIHIRPYLLDRTLQFDTQQAVGKYRVKGYVKDASGNREEKSSEELVYSLQSSVQGASVKEPQVKKTSTKKTSIKKKKSKSKKK